MIKLKDLLLEAVSQGELNQVEKYLDKIWGSVGIDVEFTRHFMDRVNDARNGKPINPTEPVINIFTVYLLKFFNCDFIIFLRFFIERKSLLS